MNFVRMYIYSLIIFGMVFALRFGFNALFGLFMENPDILSTILAVIVAFGISIWYVDWNMKR